MNQKAEVEFFQKFQETHGDYDVLGELAYRRLCSVFHRRMVPQAGGRCADLGCGAGAFTRHLRQFDLQLLGIDLSSNLIEIARSKATTDCYQVGDILKTGWADQSYDIIVFSGVLHHLPTPELRLQALTEAHRLLKIGGRLFAFDPNFFSPSMWLYRHPSSPFYSNKGKTENEVLLKPSDLTSELEKAGLQNIVVEALSGITFQFVESERARRLLPLYNLYEIMMMIPFLQKFWGTFLISTAQRTN